MSLSLLLPLSLLPALMLPSALRADARSLALGNAVTASRIGDLAGNPALLMRLDENRAATDGALIELGGGFDVRDSGGAVTVLRDNALLPEAVENSIVALTEQDITCITDQASLDTPCLDGTAVLGQNAERLGIALEQLDGQRVDTLLLGNLGVGVVNDRARFAFSYDARFVATGTVAVADGDRLLLDELADVLSDGSLTVGDVQDTTLLTVDAVQQGLGVNSSDRLLASEASGGVLLRHQLGLTLATTLNAGALPIDLGVTPRLSFLQASSLTAQLNELFNDSMIPLDDRFDQNGVERTTFTADIGLATRVTPSISLALSGKNLISESITSSDGYTFETTPQAIAGVAWSQGALRLSASAALNAASVDNVRSQPVTVGMELGSDLFAVRVGVSQDNERRGEATTLGFGFALGPLEMGVRGANTDTVQGRLDLKFGF